MNYVKITKDTIKRVKRRVTDWKNIFTIHASHNGFKSKIRIIKNFTNN